MGMKTYYQEQNKGVRYERESYMYGGGWASYEKGINPGTVRVINGVLSEAWSIQTRGPFRKPRVLWHAVDPGALRQVDINERPGP